MKAAIKWIMIDDVADREVFCALVQILISPAGIEGGEMFALSACSPKWFEENMLWSSPTLRSDESPPRAVFGRHYLFQHTFNASEIEERVRRVVSNAEGADWHELALHLSRYFHWEFEDYRE